MMELRGLNARSGWSELSPTPREPVERKARGDTARRPSITDVARLAGFSHQTVSRVLNGHPSVRPVTRARVLAAIEELGYRPNSAARTLASGRSKTLGVVAIDTIHYGPSSTLYGIEQAARNAGYFVSIVSVQAFDRMSVRDAIDRLVDQGVEGIAVIAPFVSAQAALDELPEKMPVVAVEGNPEAELSVVTVDQVEGARLATSYLLSLGHETVFHVAGPPEWQEARLRLEGWRQAVAESGAGVPPVVSGDWSARSGYSAGQVLARVPEATAIFVANDQMALGLLLALHERGRAVPDEVSIVGFDDVPEAEFFVPPLTTVRQDFAQVGRAAVELLVEQVEAGSRLARRVVILPELVVRASAGHPKVA